MFKPLCKVTLVLVVAFVAANAIAATASHDEPAMKTFMQPNLSLKTVLSPDLAQPDVVVGPQAFSLRTCRCSCGFRCETNADCGPGGVCAPGITCCATNHGNDATAKVFRGRESLSSRQTPSLIPVSVNCK
jgi:hypothetical protein